MCMCVCTHTHSPRHLPNSFMNLANYATEFFTGMPGGFDLRRQIQQLLPIKNMFGLGREVGKPLQLSNDSDSNIK